MNWKRLIIVLRSIFMHWNCYPCIAYMGHRYLLASVQFDTLDFEIFVLRYLLDRVGRPVDDLCLTNQIYLLLLWMLLNSTKSLKCTMLTLIKMLLKDDETRGCRMTATRQHLARLLKYYPRQSCAPSLIKARFVSHTINLLTVLTFLHFEIPFMYTFGES